MAHEVESMFYTGETPWHGLGKHVKESPSIADAIVCAGLDWKVRCDDLFTKAGTQAPMRATVRESDGRILGVVGADYVPLQNSEAFAFFEPFVAAKEALLETAGSLRDGARVWVLARINRAPSVIVKGDEVEKFVLLSNGHDGTMAVRVGFTPIRVVCANTLAMAHGDKASKLLRVRHTKNVVQNIEAIREIVNLADAEFEATAEQFRLLASRGVNGDDLEKYVRKVFYDRAGGVDAKKSKIVEKVTELFEKGRGNNLPGVRGTFWGAYNAVTEYLAWEKGANDQHNAAEKIEKNATRLDLTWFGHNAMFNKRALDAAVQMAIAA